ncbi:hypothetical protein LXL04_022514 [Taraxacum kok-saghyz]
MMASKHIISIASKTSEETKPIGFKLAQVVVPPSIAAVKIGSSATLEFLEANHSSEFVIPSSEIVSQMDLRIEVKIDAIKNNLLIFLCNRFHPFHTASTRHQNHLTASTESIRIKEMD